MTQEEDDEKTKQVSWWSIIGIIFLVLILLIALFFIFYAVFRWTPPDIKYEVVKVYYEGE